ncbi:hypothetical protein DH2020_005162 [Rehmannia glutinosa]|uniref:Uncharacterized protein n=1 Tax=Rehmannia glutinosa TaxID=99300 RepID=A0ABR0XRH4_REHGL
MSKKYDNWERLVTTVMRRERDKQLALTHSRDPSTISSTSSSFDLSFSSTFQFNDDDESLVRPQARPLPTEYSDLSLDHDEWKAMLPPGKQEVLFVEVAEFKYSMMINIQATIKTQMLSPYTDYEAYLVFRKNEDILVYHEANSSIRILSGEPDDYSRKHDYVLHFQAGTKREDGWMEVRLAGINFGQGDIVEIQVQLAAWNGYPKSGIIIEGIEFRPWGSPPLLYKEPGPEELSQAIDTLINMIQSAWAALHST